MQTTRLRNIIERNITLLIFCVSLSSHSHAQNVYTENLPSVEIHLDALSQFQTSSPSILKERYASRNYQRKGVVAPLPRKNAPKPSLSSIPKTPSKKTAPLLDKKPITPPLLKDIDKKASEEKPVLLEKKLTVPPPLKNTDKKAPIKEDPPLVKKEDTAKKASPSSPETLSFQATLPSSFLFPKENILKKEVFPVAPTTGNTIISPSVATEEPSQPTTLPKEKKNPPSSMEKDTASPKDPLPIKQSQDPMVSQKVQKESEGIKEIKTQNLPLITPPNFTPDQKNPSPSSQKTTNTLPTKPVAETIPTAFPPSSLPGKGLPAPKEIKEEANKPKEPDLLPSIPMETEPKKSSWWPSSPEKEEPSIPPAIIPMEPSSPKEPEIPSLPPVPLPSTFKTSSLSPSSPSLSKALNGPEEKPIPYGKKAGFVPPPLNYAKNDPGLLEEQPSISLKSEEPKPHFIMSNMALPDDIASTSQEKDDFLLTIDFKKGETALPEDPNVKVILAKMVENFKAKKVNRFTIVSYANDANDHPDSARRISLHRAIAIRKNLIENGIESAYISVRAMGATLDANKNKDIVYIQQGTSS